MTAAVNSIRNAISLRKVSRSHFMLWPKAFHE